MYKIPAKTLFVGKNLVFVPECHSTNTLAQEISQSPSFIDGTVVITSHQTAGRGQRGNSWEAEPGSNLTFSLVLKPSFLLVRDQFFLNIITTLALYDLLIDKTSAGIRIKWPNDIMISGKKLCGILIENQIQGQQVSKAIIGIGLNVNQTHYHAPVATSLTRETAKTFDLPELLDDLLQHLEQRYLQLREGKRAGLKREYIDKLYWLHENHTFVSDGQSFQGRINGVDDEGRLTITADGEERRFNFQEIRFVQ